MYMIFTTERFFEVAIGRWPEWDFHSRPSIKFCSDALTD